MISISKQCHRGDRLTLREMAELIEHGITVGRPLCDYLEVPDAHEAVSWVRKLMAAMTLIAEVAVCELHRRIVSSSQPEVGGVYSTLPRRIASSLVVFPNAVKIPELMWAYGE